MTFCQRISAWIKDRQIPASSLKALPLDSGPNFGGELKLFRAISRQRFVMIGSGESLYHLAYVIARVFAAPRPKLKVPYAPVYLASVLVERAWKAFGADPPLFPRRVKFFSLDRAFDISKARDVLGFHPEVRLEEGLRMTAAWYASEGLL